MQSLSINFEVKDTDKKDGVLTDDFKISATGTFGKAILDLVMEGYEVTVKKVQFNEQTIEVEEDLIVVDENGKEKTVKEKTNKDAYVAVATLDIISRTINNTKSCTRNPVLEPRIIVEDGQLKVGSINSNDESTNNKDSTGKDIETAKSEVV